MPATEISKPVPSLNSLISLRDDDLARIDLAELNLACACGLPGAEEIDLCALLSKLDDWADEAKHEIQRNWYRFLADPGDYENSPGYFRILVLITTLQRDLGMRYNPERVKDPKFQDPYCDHLYCRWDDVHGQFFPRERFNIEGAGQGFGMYPDSFYETWPRELTDFERESGAYGKCLSPREELACFLTTRGHCLLDNGRRDQAVECFRWSVELAPRDKRYQLQLNSILNPNPGRYYIPPRSPYPPGGVVEGPCGSLPPADLPWGVPIKYVAVSQRGALPGRQSLPGRTVKVAAGRPLPTCLPPGTPMQVVPADQADDLSAFEAAAKRPQTVPQFGRPPQPAFGINHNWPGISGAHRGPPLGLPGL